MGQIESALKWGRLLFWGKSHEFCIGCALPAKMLNMPRGNKLELGCVRENHSPLLQVSFPLCDLPCSQQLLGGCSRSTRVPLWALGPEGSPVTSHVLAVGPWGSLSPSLPL